MVIQYRDLNVWRRSVELATSCYRITEDFPPSELYGLVSQIRRSSVSVPANIAEGNGRDHVRDYLRHLSYATGSLRELETHLHIANRLKFADQETVGDLLRNTDEIGRMLTGLKKSLRALPRASP